MLATTPNPKTFMDGMRSDFSRPVVVFGIVGQSNADGAGCRYRDVNDPDLPVDGQFPGCYIFDKTARKFRLMVDLKSEVRALTPGYAGGELAPWTHPKNDYFGPELSFAHDYERKTGHTVVVVKLAIGGSRVAKGEFHNWNVRGSEQYGLLNVFLNGYWSPTMAWLRSRAKDIRVGGMISMVGGSDARTEKSALEYPQNMAGIIGMTRAHIAPENPMSVRWLVVKTPRITLNGSVVGFLKQIREGQESLAALPNVTVQNLVKPVFHEHDHIHLSAKGQVRLGRQMAAWALEEAK